jgi:hypothetical protein
VSLFHGGVIHGSLRLLAFEPPRDISWDDHCRFNPEWHVEWSLLQYRRDRLPQLFGSFDNSG